MMRIQTAGLVRSIIANSTIAENHLTIEIHELSMRTNDFNAE